LFFYNFNASKSDYLAGYKFKGTAKNKAANIKNFPIVTTTVGIEEITTGSI